MTCSLVMPMGSRMSASMTHVLGIMLTLRPPCTTPALSVTRWSISDAPSPWALSTASEARSSTAWMLLGVAGVISVTASRSQIRRAATFVALSLAWV